MFHTDFSLNCGREDLVTETTKRVQQLVLCQVIGRYTTHLLLSPAAAPSAAAVSAARCCSEEIQNKLGPPTSCQKEPLMSEQVKLIDSSCSDSAHAQNMILSSQATVLLSRGPHIKHKQDPSNQMEPSKIQSCACTGKDCVCLKCVPAL